MAGYEDDEAESSTSSLPPLWFEVLLLEESLEIAVNFLDRVFLRVYGAAAESYFTELAK